jgi:hypothetical protein
MNKINKLNYKIKVIDNFLNKKDFYDLCNINIAKNISNNFKIYHNKINDHGIIESSIDKNLLLRLHKNYHHKALEVLNELSSEKLELYEYSDFTIIITNKNSKFPIHDDTPNKLLSGVVYLSPENNSGTSFYTNQNGDNKTSIKWVCNNAVFFSRKEQETWHSYEGNGIENRIVLVYNLMTTNIKKVFKIEKKNYLLGSFRYRFNPYFYKYLKITI